MSNRNCDHENWNINGNYTGLCLDCKKEIPINELFNGLKKRMDMRLETLNDQLSYIVDEATVNLLRRER